MYFKIYFYFLKNYSLGNIIILVLMFMDEVYVQS